MSVLRSIIARFTVDVDQKPLSDLDKRMSALKSRMATFAGYATAAFGVVGGGAYMLAEAASRADENWNAIQVTFKENAEGIKDWSKEVGLAMSRSEYSFQEAAVSFGKFLAPMFRDSGQDITAMSKKLAELSVDLASFHDVTDEEATMRLFSGMAGETEAVRKLGIDLSDTGLNEFNSKKKGGDGRKMQQLTLAEKSWIRYRKIIKDTTDAVGDAQRSGDRWAGVLKRIQGRIKTVSVEWGRRLMPIMTKVLALVDNALIGLDKLVVYLADHTETLSAVFYTAAAAAAFWALQNSIVTLSLEFLLKRLLPIAAAFLAIEDVLVGLDGGDAIFSRLTEGLLGMKRTAFLVKDVFQTIIIQLRNMWNLAKHMVSLTAERLGRADPFGLADGSSLFSDPAYVDPIEEIEKRKNAAIKEALQNDDLQSFQQAAYDLGEQDPQAVRSRYIIERQKFLKDNPEHQMTDYDKQLGLDIEGPIKYKKSPYGTPVSMMSQEEQIMRARVGPKQYDEVLRHQAIKEQRNYNQPSAPTKVENTMSITIDGAKDTQSIVDEIEDRWSSMTREVNYSAAEGMDD